MCGGVHQRVAEDGVANDLVQENVLVQRENPNYPGGPKPGETAPQHEHLYNGTMGAGQV